MSSLRLASFRLGDVAVALVACGIAAGAELVFNRLVTVEVTPLLTGLGAVIFSAAWAGSVAGWTAMVLMTIWCALRMSVGWHYTPPDVILRCGLFAAEAALVTIGSGRLFRIRGELEKSNNRMRQLVDTAAEGILIQNGGGIITYANARMNEMLAAGLGGLQNRRFEDFLFPEDVSAARFRLQRRGSAAREQIDRHLRRADGSEIWVLSCSNPVFDERGDFAGILSMMTDITERKAAETALRRSEEKFRGLFENVVEGVYQSTPDGRILAANPMLLKMLDLKSEAEMNDVNISKDLYVDPKVRQHLLVILERDGSFQNVEFDLRRRDGRIITVLENARVVRDASGDVLYYEGTLTDITNRKRVEDQLRQAQKTEALAGLASGVAQDFNSILTVITGYCELLATDSSLSTSARDYALEALRAAETAGKLTRQLVALNNPRAGEEAPVDMSAAVRKIEPSVRRSLGRDIELRISLEEGAAVFVDSAQIGQIVANLTNNSREAMPRGGVIQITTECVHVDTEFAVGHAGASPGEYARLSVHDTGLGIPLHLIGKLTDPMFSMGKSRVTGLGLSTVHAIAVRHGGFITADSTPGIGATFSVYLPLAPPANAGEDPMRGARPGETVLIVEEESLGRDLSREMLERLGYRVIAAASAEEAERVATSGRRLDLLMASTALCSGSGAELARRLTARRPALKVLLVSGRGEPPKSGQLRKPFSDEMLGRKVRQILDQH